MKRRIATYVCALAVLIWICPPARADYPGTLQGNQGWEINVDAASANATALTVYYLGDRRVLDLDILTVPPGSRLTLSFPMPGRGVRRIVIQVDPQGNSAVGLEIKQGATSYTYSSNGDGRLVLDVK